MRSFSLIFLLWILVSAVSGQTPHPGAVTGAIQWYSADSAVAAPGLRDRLDGQAGLLSFEHATMASLNFHPALVFSGLNPLRVNLGDRDLRSASYFTVYQSLDTANENSIWHITNDQGAALVLTTDRMADLSVHQYMNYRDVVRAQPKVNVYVQHKEKDSVAAGRQWWNIGVKPSFPQLPVVNFKGMIPEIIVYDRVLNSIERLRVASYLALKYGITLTEPGASYCNSSGEKIWDGYDYPEWHRNIAGICRDDPAGLHQSMATSSNAPGLLTISARDPLNDNSYLLWGDNGKALTAADRIAGLPLMLQKTWLMKPYGNLAPFVTDLVLDTKAVDAVLPLHPTYWLAIDHSGKGKFNSADIEFIKMDLLDNQGKASFKNVAWDKDGSGKDVWGIIAGQDLLLATVIHQPVCSAPGTGSMDVRILGGRAPYQLTVQNAGGVVMSRSIDHAVAPLNINGLGAGKYLLSVTDAALVRTGDSFYINNEDGPRPVALAASYTLPAGRPLVLNAGENAPDPVVWEWSGPANFQSFSPQVSITAPGSYTLRCSKNGCSNVQDIVVSAGHDNILYDVTLFPNPSPGAFSARVRLDHPAPLTMNVYGPDGRFLSSQRGDQRSNYLFAGELKASGAYELVFISGLSKTSKTLVIVK